jgi:hypothetical protein
MNLGLSRLVAMLTATSFAAGLNLYVTIAALGLLGRTKLLTLPPSLALLQEPWVIGAAVVLVLVEFVADKIPIVDLVWNGLHTFIRPPVAALLAYQASAPLSLNLQIACTMLGGLIAFAAHAGKTTLRAAVTPSPEPISNVMLSVGEDAIAVFLTWLTTEHPYLAAVIALTGVVVVVLVVRLAIRAVRALFRGLQRKNYTTTET